MRSRQINFFIVPEDFPEIRSFLLENNICAIPQPLQSAAIEYTKELTPTKEKEFDTVFLSNLDFQENISVDYITKQNYYLIDDLRSFVIEFSRGGAHFGDPGILDSGKLYFITSYYDGSGTLVWKDEKFILWAQKVRASFKKQFLKHKIDSHYLSVNAFKWMNDNNKKIHPSGLTIG